MGLILNDFIWEIHPEKQQSYENAVQEVCKKCIFSEPSYFPYAELVLKPVSHILLQKSNL